MTDHYPAQIKIKLINAIDEALISRELLSLKALRSCEVEAVIDPSLIYLMLPEQVARQLGLRRVSQQPDGRPVTEALRLAWDGQVITEDALIAGEQVRLGRVVLEKLNLLDDSPELVVQSAPIELLQPDFWEPDFWEPDFWEPEAV